MDTVIRFPTERRISSKVERARQGETATSILFPRRSNETAAAKVREAHPHTPAAEGQSR